MRSKCKVRTLIFLAIATITCPVPGSAQVPSPSAPAPPAPAPPKSGRASVGARSGPVIVETRPTAPQVVTILHRLNGLKMFRLLLRSSQELRAVTRLDDAFRMTDEVHTNVIAGLALDDGQTIVAWLPDAEVEMGPPPTPFAPAAPAGPMAPSRVSGKSARVTVAPPSPLGGAGPPNFLRDLT